MSVFNITHDFAAVTFLPPYITVTLKDQQSMVCNDATIIMPRKFIAALFETL